MRNNFVLLERNAVDAQGITIGMLSGDMTGIAAAADVAGVRNILDVPLVVDGVRIRCVTKTAFGTAQALAFRMNKVTGFTAVHDTGTPIACQAHYNFGEGVKTDMAGAALTTGSRIPLTEISSVISSTAAISISGGYTGEDVDEPELFAVGAGSTLPGVYENWYPLLPLVLPKNTGLVFNNHIAMGAAGVVHLFIGIDCHRQG